MTPTSPDGTLLRLPYPCYEPEVFNLCCAILRRRKIERAKKRYRKADRLRRILESHRLTVYDAPYGSFFADESIHHPVARWALFYDTARRTGIDVEEFAGSASNWARASGNYAPH